MIAYSLKWGMFWFSLQLCVFTSSGGFGTLSTASFLKEQTMEDPHSVSSPRRILSLSKKRRSTVSSLDADDRASGFGVSGEHGPKPSEVYGFVGSITTVVATGSLHRSCFYFMFRLG
jgi:hypothetical protein